MIFFVLCNESPWDYGAIIFLFKRYFFYLCSLGFFVYDVHIIRKKVGENAEVFASFSVVFCGFFVV